MELKIKLLGFRWMPSDEIRDTAVIDPKNKFEDKIKNVKLTSVFVSPFQITSYDVEYLSASNCLMLKNIPQNLGNFFLNLIALNLTNCGLQKIDKNDLKGLKKLREISLRQMAIEELPSDLFEGSTRLVVIQLRENKIKFIGKDIFKHLNQLTYVDLSKNTSIDLLYADQSYDNVEAAFTTRIFHLHELNTKLDEIFHIQPGNNENRALEDDDNVYTDLKKILNSEDFKDFTIKINENEFKVHKLMLAARSPTLAEMIKNNPDADELILEDIEVEVFKVILDYIYNDKLPEQDLDLNFDKIFAAAGKLNLKKLKNHCGLILCDFVTKNNSIEFLSLAIKHDHDDLKKSCIRVIKNIFSDTAYSFEDKVFENFELLKVIVEEKLRTDERIKKTVEKFNKLKM